MEENGSLMFEVRGQRGRTGWRWQKGNGELNNRVLTTGVIGDFISILIIC